MYVDLKYGINIGQSFVTLNKPTKLSVGMVTLTRTGLLATHGRHSLSRVKKL